VAGYLNINLLQICHWVWQWKNFKNRLTSGKVMGKSLVSCFFLTHGVDGRRYSLAFRRRLRRRYTNNNIQRIHGSECGVEIWWPSVENVALELRPRATFSTSGSSYFNANLITMHYLYIVVQTYIRIHTVSKNDTDVACCNFDEHQPILIIFDRGVAERALTNGAVFSHPTLLMSSALPGKTRKRKNRNLHA